MLGKNMKLVKNFIPKQNIQERKLIKVGMIVFQFIKRVIKSKIIIFFSPKGIIKIRDNPK
jgi:hypothetical protein